VGERLQYEEYTISAQLHPRTTPGRRGRAGTLKERKKEGQGLMDAPSFLALSFAKIPDVIPIPSLALRRHPQRILHLPLNRRRMKRPKVL
jgi:hypothetical protein